MASSSAMTTRTANVQAPSVARLARFRDEPVEQLAFFTEAADDARLRALVSETPLATYDHDEAQRHAVAMARHRADVLASIRELERSQDELLDRLVSEPS